jgi:hypothetical protein
VRHRRQEVVLGAVRGFGLDARVARPLFGRDDALARLDLLGDVAEVADDAEAPRRATECG